MKKYRTITRGSLLLPVIISVKESRLQATMTSSVMDLDPNPLGPVAPIRYFIVSDISLTTIILLLFGTSTCTVRP
jgi:hypothetical protein